jgi:hypothetical protein
MGVFGTRTIALYSSGRRTVPSFGKANSYVIEPMMNERKSD